MGTRTDAHLVPKSATRFEWNLLDEQTPEIAFGQLQSQILAIRKNLGKLVRLQIFKDAVESIYLVGRLGEKGKKTRAGEEVDQGVEGERRRGCEEEHGGEMSDIWCL